MKRITAKVALLVVATSSIVAGAIGLAGQRTMARQTENAIATLEHALRDDYDRAIRWQVETAVSLLAGVHQRVESGAISPQSGRDLAADLVRELAYGEDGYFWIDTYAGTNVVLLGSETEGTYRMNLRDAQGTPLIQQIIAAGRSAGGGFTNYYFPRPGQEEALPKRSYSLAFDPWEWVLGTGNYVDDIDAAVSAFASRLNADLVASRRASLMMLGGGLAMAVIVSLVLGSRLTRPIRTTSSALTEIAQGDADLGRRLAVVSNDEIGALASAYNGFVSGLSSIVSAVRDAVGGASEESIELNAASAETAAAAEEIAATVRSVTEQTQALNTEVAASTAAAQSINDCAQRLRESVGTQASAVEQSSASVEQIVASIQNISRTASERVQVMNELRESTGRGKSEIEATETKAGALSDSVGEVLRVTAVISDIAERTNLLAMNAAIEAAHAGESGRGFAVVSDEIRKLAVSASEHSKAIDTTLKHTVAEIHSLGQITRSASTQYEAVEMGARASSQAFTEIAAAMQELSSGAKEIQRAVADLRNTTQEVGSGAREMTDAGAVVTASAERVLSVAGSLHAAMQEIDNGAREISDAMGTLNDTVVHLSTLNSSIRDTVARFRDEGAIAS